MIHKNTVLVLLFICWAINLNAQNDTATFSFKKHTIHSSFLNQEREYWVSLPLRYSDSIDYPVIYVLDAEWRFNLVRNIAFDLGGNKKIQNAIILGIPHVEMEFTRSKDLTFSESRMEYDGESVDSTWYNSLNSGGGFKFFQFLTKEVIPSVNNDYSASNHFTLVGHSLGGGYFGGYILSMKHPFSALHLYDPSIWFGDGEVNDLIKGGIFGEREISIHLTFQPIPQFHADKIREFISILEKEPKIKLSFKEYEEETHNSLFLDSFLEGIKNTLK